MSYTYPEALTALESVLNDFSKIMRGTAHVPVRVVCDIYAKTASVTWTTYEARVNMPVRAANAVMTQAEFEDWVSYGLHELGHPTHTDQGVWQAACASGHSRLLNALEDVRIEAAVIASGSVPNARAVLSRLIARKVAEARVAKWKPNARREFGWTACVLGRAANGYTIDPADLAWIKSEIKPGSTVASVLAWTLPALAACSSTQDCLTLAERVAAALAAPSNAPMPINPNPGADTNPGAGEGDEGEGDEGDEGEDTDGGEGVSENELEGEGDDEAAPEGEDKGAGEGAGEGGEDSPGEDEGAGEAPKGPQGPPNGEGEGAGKGGTGHGDGSTSDEAPVISEKDLAEHDLAPQGEAMDGHKPGASAEKSVIDILRSGVMKDQPKREENRTSERLGVRGERLRDAAAQASKQRALLARALRANETDDREGGRKAGRLDKGALTRAMAGSTNVFAKREIQEGFDTDVCVLLDASGSMAGNNMHAALEVGLVVAQAAGSVGAACTTEIFNSQGYIRAGALASRRLPNPADYGALVNGANGGTPLSAHMARVAVNQAKRAPHKRRVVFVITDGQCDYGPATLKRMATYLEQSCGVVLAHVSIGTPVSGCFRAEVRVPHGVPLAKVGLDHFVKVIQAI